MLQGKTVEQLAYIIAIVLIVLASILFVGILVAMIRLVW